MKKFKRGLSLVSFTYLRQPLFFSFFNAKEKKLTQAQLAEKANLTNNYISNIETHHSIPSLETLVKICNALEVTPNDLLVGTVQTSSEYFVQETFEKFNQCTPRERRDFTQQEIAYYSDTTHSSTNDSESETISTESDTDREMQSTIENSSESTVQSTNNASDNLSTSGNQSEQASNSVTETKHSSPENAIKEYCQTFSDKNVEACKKIVPPDYLYYIDENKEENPNAGWWLGTGENNSDKIRVTEFKQNIKLERGEEMYEWYLNYYTAIKSTNAEKITMYTTSTIVDFGYGEEQTESDFFCVFENGKWYAVIAD